MMTSETASTLLKAVVIVGEHYHFPRNNRGLTLESDLGVKLCRDTTFVLRPFSAYSLNLIDEIPEFIQSCKSYIKIISKLLSAPADFFKKLSYLNTIITSNK